jgi:hypothetical protein
MRMSFLHSAGFTWEVAWDQIVNEFRQRFEIQLSPWQFVAQLLWTLPALLIIPIAFFNRVAAAYFSLVCALLALLVFRYGFEYGLLPQDHGPYMACGLFSLIGLALLPASRTNEAFGRPPLANVHITIALFLIWCSMLALGHFTEVFNIIAFGGTMTAWELARQYVDHFLPVFLLFMGVVVIPLSWLRPHWTPRYALTVAALLLVTMGWNRIEFANLSLRTVMLPWIVLGMVALPWPASPPSRAVRGG